MKDSSLSDQVNQASSVQDADARFEETVRNERLGQYALHVATKDLTEIDLALTQEGIADCYAWGQSFWHMGKAAYTMSVEPLVEGRHYIESMVSTFPIIGPLVAERCVSSKTKNRISNTVELCAVNPDSLTEAELWEIRELGDSNKHPLTDYKKRSFAKAVWKDWTKMMSPTRGLIPLGASFSKAGLQLIRTPLSSIPFNPSTIQHVQLQQNLQCELLEQNSLHVKENIRLHANEDDNGKIQITVDKRALKEQSDFHTKHCITTSSRAFFSSFAVAGATNFILNEGSMGVQSVVALSETFKNTVPIFAHVIPASLTLAPLKKALDKFSEHLSHLSHERDQQYLYEYIDHLSEQQPS